jgi:hypothetical protein
LVEQVASREQQHQRSVISVMKTDPNCARTSRRSSESMQILEYVNNDDDSSHDKDAEEVSSIENDMEFVCSLTNASSLEEEEEDDDELLCINKDGIEKILCFDQEQRDRDRFEMLDDHTHEVIRHSESHLQKQLGSLLSTPLRLLTPSSVPLSAATTTTVSPTSQRESPQFEESLYLYHLIPSFGATDLRTSKVLPMSLLRHWSVQLVKVIFDLHARGIYIQDLNPSNILLSEEGQLTLTYQCEWVSVDKPLEPRALDQLYCAPEVISVCNLILKKKSQYRYFRFLGGFPYRYFSISPKKL